MLKTWKFLKKNGKCQTILENFNLFWKITKILEIPRKFSKYPSKVFLVFFHFWGHSTSMTYSNVQRIHSFNMQCKNVNQSGESLNGETRKNKGGWNFCILLHAGGAEPKGGAGASGGGGGGKANKENIRFFDESLPNEDDEDRLAQSLKDIRKDFPKTDQTWSFSDIIEADRL